MTTLEYTADHHDAVRLTGAQPHLRFPPRGTVEVDHETACDAVETHAHVEFYKPIPQEYDELRSIAAELPTDRVKGDASADEIVEFLELFTADDAATLCDDPSALVVDDSGFTTTFRVDSESGEGE